MRKKLSLTAFLMMICVIGLVSTCNGQSFQQARGYSIKGSGHDNQCHAVHKQKTIGQKLRNKVKYHRKRHHSEAFNYRETRRHIKKQGFRI